MKVKGCFKCRSTFCEAYFGRECPDSCHLQEKVILGENRFKECDTCRAKPGSPTLCSGCLYNRELVAQYEEIINKNY